MCVLGRSFLAPLTLTGFDKDGRPTNYAGPGAIKYKTIKEVVSASAKLITLVDLAGHEKYIRTTGAWMVNGR